MTYLLNVLKFSIKIKSYAKNYLMDDHNPLLLLVLPDSQHYPTQQLA